jgi:hypothetical protein
MAQVSNNSPTIRTLLLLPGHVHVITFSLPFLVRLQSLLNESYTASYCAHPSILGTKHVRIAHPGQLEDVIGPWFYNYPSTDKRAQ